MREILPPPGKAAVLGLVLLMMIVSTAAADGSINITDSVEEVWMNSGHDTTVNGEAACSGSGFSGIYIDTPGDRIPTDKKTGSFELEMDNYVEQYGNYALELECGTGGVDDTTGFMVKKLTLAREEQDRSLELYRGDSFQIRLNATNGFEQITLDDSASSFSAGFLEAGQLDIVYNSPDGKDAVLETRVPEDAEIGEHFLVSGFTYDSPSGETVSVESENAGDVRVKVKKPWQAEVVNKTPARGEISYSKLSSDLGNMFVDVRVERKGSPRNALNSDAFYVEVEKDSGAKNEYPVDSDRLEGDGMYRLKLTKLPTLSLGEHEFNFFLDKGGETDITNFTVSQYITLSGSITDATGRPVSPSIQVERDGLVQTFAASGGSYSMDLLPGEYNFSINFEEAAARFDEVELKKGVMGSIAYDDVPVDQLSSQVEGVTVINAVSVKFGYPFDEAQVTMSYNPNDVSFQDLRVFQCKQWKFRSRFCGSDWELIEVNRSQIFPTVGKVVFEADPVNITKDRNFLQNGFMIVRNTQLEPTFLELSEQRVPVGTEFEVQGNIVTAEGNTVEGVTVVASVLEDGEVVRNVTGETDSEGNFAVPVSAPEEDGTYEVKAEVSQTPYSGFSRTLDGSLDTYTQRSVSLREPGTVEFYPGRESETRFTVVNTGQAPIKDVKMRINGLKNTWYSFQKGSWDEISPGSSKTALMEVTLPEDYCGDECREYPQFDAEVVARSGEKSLNDVLTIQSVVTKEANATDLPEPDGASSEGVETPGVVTATGDFLASQSSLNIFLGLMTVFVLALAGAIKRKQPSNSDRELRDIGGASGGGQVSGRSSGDRPTRISSEPQVSSPEEADEKEGTESTDETADVEEKTEGQDSGGTNLDGENHTCDVCGEEFDTESALSLHKKAVH